MPVTLTKDFTLDEFVFSQVAARAGIENKPNTSQIAELRSLCESVLQPLRNALAAPIIVTSGFRSARLNKAVDGAVDSQHMEGRAADILCPRVGTRNLFKKVIELELPFDQLIYEGGKQCVWVHVSFNRNRNRGEILRATFPPAGGVLCAQLSETEALAL